MSVQTLCPILNWVVWEFFIYLYINPLSYIWLANTCPFRGLSFHFQIFKFWWSSAFCPKDNEELMVNTPAPNPCAELRWLQQQEFFSSVLRRSLELPLPPQVEDPTQNSSCSRDTSPVSEKGIAWIWIPENPVVESSPGSYREDHHRTPCLAAAWPPSSVFSGLLLLTAGSPHSACLCPAGPLSAPASALEGQGEEQGIGRVRKPSEDMRWVPAAVQEKASGRCWKTSILVLALSLVSVPRKISILFFFFIYLFIHLWLCWVFVSRSEERRVGKECRSRWSPDH